MSSSTLMTWKLDQKSLIQITIRITCHSDNGLVKVYNSNVSAIQILGIQILTVHIFHLWFALNLSNCYFIKSNQNSRDPNTGNGWYWSGQNKYSLQMVWYLKANQIPDIKVSGIWICTVFKCSVRGSEVLNTSSSRY